MLSMLLQWYFIPMLLSCQVLEDHAKSSAVYGAVSSAISALQQTSKQEVVVQGKDFSPDEHDIAHALVSRHSLYR